MFTAIHSSSDQLISGVDVIDPKSLFSDTDTYCCLLCNDEVEFNRRADQHELFTHSSGKDDCFSRPQNSVVHQVGCEKAIKTACTQLGYDRETVDIESDIKKGGGSMRADVVIEEPEPVVVELYYKSRLCALYRKLDVMLNKGYSCYIICVAPGQYKPAHKPEDFDESLQEYGPIEVGRFVPEFNMLSFGTRITAEIVDLKLPSRVDGDGYILSG
ncbi:hypothetical protein [Halapricum hydrolyticum]|uniref:C2H2-type domain-containing protein n=1 Tax=Halapricum hydrolyticum TaxID=2979991 RepID=A0AAE3IB46_9EURY|nr:hypothetical protein [Halapricum hydrolyticum]MCU4717574.1 hypothetical protein [Halapricum hydrolyticum]MCU4726897.1 hypothetical protein [Halapricum hydrolyticum]